jgi:hypothetical protein
MYISFKMCSEKQRQHFNIVTRLWSKRAVHRDSIPAEKAIYIIYSAFIPVLGSIKSLWRQSRSCLEFYHHCVSSFYGFVLI